MGIMYEKSFNDDFFVSLVKKNDNELLGVQHTSRRLYLINFDTNTESLFKDLFFEDDGIFKLFQTAVCVDNKVYLLPFNGDDFVILENDDIKKFDFSKLLSNCDNGKFMNAVKIEKYLVLIPYSSELIVWFDLEKEEIAKVVNIKELIKEGDLFYSAVIVNDTLYMPSMMSDTIICYNIQSEKLFSFGTGVVDDGYTYIFEQSDKLYLLAKSKPSLIEYNLLSKNVSENLGFPDGLKSYGKTYFDPKCTFLVDQYLYCIPGTANMAVRINIETGNIEEISCLEEFSKNNSLDKGRFVFDGGVRDENILYLQYQNNVFVEFDTREQSMVKYEMMLNTKNAGLEYFLNNILRC